MSTYGDIRTRFEVAMNEAKLEVWKQTMKKAYFNLYPEGKGGRWINPSGTGEIMRAYFIGDAEAEIEKFLELNGVKAEYYGGYLKTSNASGSFDSWEITMNTNCDWFGKTLESGKTYYIINARKTSGDTVAAIGDKDSTPNKLGLTDIQYPTKEQAIVAAKESIKAKINDEDSAAFMNELIDVVSNFKTTAVGEAKDLANTDTSYTITHDFSKYTEIIDRVSVLNIAKDFGEVLGGILMFNLTKNHGAGLIFPEASNEAVVDFRFDKMDVSSKADKGATASASGYLNKLNAAIEMKDWKLNKKEANFIENFSKVILAKQSEGSNTRYCKRSRGSATFSSTVVLLNNFKVKSWNHWASESGMPTQNIGRDDIIHSFVQLKEAGKLHKTLNSFSGMVGGLKGNSSKKSSAAAKMTAKFLSAKNEKEAVEVLDEILKIDNPGIYDVLIGTVIYGSTKELVPLLNKEFGETMSGLINMAFSAKQLYLKLNIKKGSLIFTMKSMKTSNFVIKGLNGVDSWSIKGLGISLK